MQRLTVLVLLLSLLVSVSAFTGKAMAAEEVAALQTVIRAGSQPSFKGPAQYFTGDVQVDPLFPADEATNFSGAYVTFEPGARSAWHVHPAGQRLIVTAGVGWTQEWGGPVIEIRAGDVVWCPPGVKHWHGASPSTQMTHLTLTGVLDGKNVVWMEKVSDEQYSR